MEGRRRYVVALGCLNEVSLMRTEREGDGRSAILSFGAVTIVCLPSTRAKSKREREQRIRTDQRARNRCQGIRTKGKTIAVMYLTIPPAGLGSVTGIQLCVRAH